MKMTKFLSFLGSLIIAAFLLPNAVAADCAAGSGLHPLVSPKLATKLPQLTLKKSNSAGSLNPISIVGLWHVTYLTDTGSEFAQSFDQWFADGNEFEVAYFAPGTECQGVWHQSTPGTIQLYHVGWSFDENGQLVGSYVETQTNHLMNRGNTYAGVYHFTIYDLNGNIIDEFGGTLSAARLGED